MTPLEPDATAPYMVLFVGGVLDGQLLLVASLAPARVAPVPTRPSRAPQRAWDGKAALGGPHDIYEFDGVHSGAEGHATYSLKSRRKS